MSHQPYPKALYRQDAQGAKIVNDEKEHEAAKSEGWGPHPSTVKAPEKLTERFFKAGSRVGKSEPKGK